LGEEVAPLDILDPLRLLCSMELKVGRQRAALGTEGDGPAKRAILETQRKIARSRDELNRQLREKLRDDAEEIIKTVRGKGYCFPVQ